jgi:hypothetical protein
VRTTCPRDPLHHGRIDRHLLGLQLEMERFE